MFGMAGILRLGMRGKKKFRVISRVEDGCSILDGAFAILH